MAGLGDIHKKIKTAPPATDGPTFDPFSGYGNDVVERANGLIPLGKYSDGNVRPAWPSWISEPASAAWNAWDNASYAGGHNDPETTAAMARGSFDAASLAPIGGALTGAVPEGAVAANGIVYRGGPISSKYRAVLSSDPANAAAYGEVTPATTHFRNPMEVDAGGRHWQDIPFEDGSTNIESLANRATERGHDGLTVRNVLDSPVGTKNPVPQDTTFALRRGTVRNADTGALLYANNKNAAAVPLLTQSGDRGAANGIGARIKGLFGKHDAPQEPHKIDYPKYGTDGPLKLWHVSPNSFDKFDPEMSGSVHGNSGYPKSLFFAGEGISGPNGGLTTALDKNGKPWSDSNYSYQVEINRDGAKTLDWNAPFEAQTPETQAILSDNKDDLIRWGWPQNDQVPMAATDFPSGVPLREHFNFGIDYPPSLDKMGFDIVHNLDETMVRDASRLKIISRNGEKIGANSGTGASVPLAMQAMEKRGLPDGYSLVRRPVEGGNPEYTVTSKDGHEVGAFSSIINSGSDAASVYSAYVHPDHRGKFTAEAYQGIGDDLGKAIVPSTTLLEPGYAFWNKHRPEALKNYPTYDSYREGYLRRPKSGERGVTAFSNHPMGSATSLAFSEDPQAEGYASGGSVDLQRITTNGGVPFTVAKANAPKFLALLNDLEARGYPIQSNQSGGYNDRNIAGTGTKSQHAYGNAIDVNWTDNPRGGMGKIPPDLARELAGQHGFTWGGDWKNPDPMHFEVARGGAPTEHHHDDGHDRSMPTLAQSAPQSDFFADKPLTLAGNEMPSWGPPMALGGPDYTQNPEAVDSANPQGNLVSSSAPFNAQSYRVAPENQGRHSDYMKEPSGADWVQGPLGLMPKFSDGSMPLQGFAEGGMVGLETPLQGGNGVSGAMDGALQPGYSGHLLSDIAGRTDEIPLEVSSGSYIVPADCVSALGEGNTLAGTKVLQSMFPAESPSLQFSAGGRVPIIVAGGEYALSPEQVAKIGGGDLNAGHSALDEWVKAVRAHTIQTLQSLPGPAQE